MLTMLLGGLWHGAAWTFAAWGALHGIFLVVERVSINAIGRGRLRHRFFKPVYALVTLVAVLLSWVLFRAESLQQAVAMYQVMLNPGAWTETVVAGADQLALLGFALLLAAQALFRNHRQEVWLLRLPWLLTALALGAMLALLLLSPAPSRAFIYFQF